MVNLYLRHLTFLFILGTCPLITCASQSGSPPNSESLDKRINKILDRVTEEEASFLVRRLASVLVKRSGLFSKTDYDSLGAVQLAKFMTDRGFDSEKKIEEYVINQEEKEKNELQKIWSEEKKKREEMVAMAKQKGKEVNDLKSYFEDVFVNNKETKEDLIEVLKKVKKENSKKIENNQNDSTLEEAIKRVKRTLTGKSTKDSLRQLSMYLKDNPTIKEIGNRVVKNPLNLIHLPLFIGCAAKEETVSQLLTHLYGDLTNRIDEIVQKITRDNFHPSIKRTMQMSQTTCGTREYAPLRNRKCISLLLRFDLVAYSDLSKIFPHMDR